MTRQERGLQADEAFGALPPPWPDEGLRANIRRSVLASDVSLVVIDDDPTGTQTVFNVPVLTTWDAQTLGQELAKGTPVFYILTNSRARATAEAIALAGELGRNLAHASRATGRRLSLASRSDSTLRGHFPEEVDALCEAMELRPDGVLLVPYFREGGRFTISDVHYVLEGQRLTPAAQTEFAKDPAFGYSHSDLRRWVEEKTGKRWRAQDVASVSLDLLRLQGPEAVTQMLCSLEGGRPAIVNAASDRDLEVLVWAILKAEAQGKRFVARCAASYVKVRGGIPDRRLLTAREVLGEGAAAGAGLVLVGSYVPRTTRQLQHLLQMPGWKGVKLEAAELLDAGQQSAALSRARRALDELLSAGCNAVVFTSREPVTGSTRQQALEIGRQISGAVVDLVRTLPARPRFLVAKGGITSSDVATGGLGVRRANVMGQIAPGVPVWRLGEESRYPGMAYVVFPGNVGTDDTLAEIAQALAGSR